MGYASMLIGVDSVCSGRYPSSTCRRAKTSTRARLFKDRKIRSIWWSHSWSTPGYLVFTPLLISVSTDQSNFLRGAGIEYSRNVLLFKIRTRNFLLELDLINSFLHRRISLFSLLRRVLWRENHFGRLNQNSIGHSTFSL